jgi:hypothetical protein
MKDHLIFKISIPSDNGFVGRACKNPECKRYFKVHLTSFKDKMYCPYCGTLFDKSELITNDQRNYVMEIGQQKAFDYAAKEFTKMLTDLTRGNKYLAFKPGKPDTYKYAPRKYCEKKVDSQIECSQCKAIFQIYGIFGYCPSCKCDNALIYDTNIQIILKEIDNSGDKKRALRHAYNDLVSTFENACKNKNVSNKKYNFQNLECAKEFFHDHLHIDMFQDLSSDEKLSIMRLFQKRHLYQHNRGIVDKRYIIMIPEDINLLNNEAPLTREEFIKGAEAMRKIMVKIV